MKDKGIDIMKKT